MTVRGCPKCKRMLTFRGTPEDHLSDIRCNQSAGCPVCGINVCGDCATALELTCDRCGHALLRNKYCEPTGDWRLPERLRLIEGIEARLAEVDRMEAEMQERWEKGEAAKWELTFYQFYREVITNDPHAEEWHFI